VKIHDFTPKKADYRISLLPLTSNSKNKTEVKIVLPSGVGNTPNIAIFRMCYGENGTVKFLETLPENVFRHNYSMVQI
jgi:hypothetical protein